MWALDVYEIFWPAWQSAWKQEKRYVGQEIMLHNFISSVVNLEDYKQSDLGLEAFGLNTFSSLLHISSS
jgi:hypothetical protein